MANQPPQNANKSLTVMQGFSSLSVFRQIGLMLGLAVSVALGVAVVLWSQEPDYVPLSSDMGLADANQIASILQSENIKFQVDTNKHMVLVEAGRIHDARIKLAAAGIATGSTLGYELLDKDSGFGMSQFMEKAKYHRSIEGELSKTISSLSTVKGARVHIAIPKKSVFVGDTRRPSASVFVEMLPGQKLTKGQVAAIVNMVAFSVPELTAKNVTVIDQKGTLLSESDGDEDILRASRQYEHVRNIEKTYLSRVQNILAPVLGEERFKVEVTAEVDFTRQEQLSETFNPDNEAVRSEQVLEEAQQGPASGQGVPGALTNQPPVQPGQEEENAASPANSRRQTARNFELDRTLSRTERQVGTISRLSVAVVVDHKPAPVDDSKKSKSKKGDAPAKVPLTQEETESLTRLVKDAIGFNAERGDSVIVINQAFLEKKTEPLEPLPEPGLLEGDWVGPAVKQGLAVLFILAFVFGVLKPILKNLAQVGKSTQALHEMASKALQESQENRNNNEKKGKEMLLPGPGENYEAQLNAIKSMIAEDPRRVAQVVKTWLTNE